MNGWDQARAVIVGVVGSGLVADQLLADLDTPTLTELLRYHLEPGDAVFVCGHLVEDGLCVVCGEVPE